MREVNSFTVGSGNAVKGALQLPVAFDDGLACVKVKDEIIIPMQQTNVAAQNLTGNDVLAALRAEFTTWKLWFGNKVQHVADNQISFDLLREMLVAMTGHDVLVYVAGIATELQAVIAAATNIATAQAQNAVVNVKCEVSRAFNFLRLATDENLWCPGASQMRQLHLEVSRTGTVFSANWSRPGGSNATHQILFDTVEVDRDNWSEVPRLTTNDVGGKEQLGPDGALLAMWERSAVGGSTTLTGFSLQRKGDVDIHTQVQASRVVADSDYMNPLGSFDLNKLQTVLFQLPESVDFQRIPTGRSWKFVQPGNDLQPAHTAWLYVPEVDTQTADNALANLVQGSNGEARKLVNAGAIANPQIPEATASVMPLSVLKPGSVNYDLAPGRQLTPAGAATTVIPQPIAAAVAQATATSPSQGAAYAAQVSKHLPGGNSAQRTAPQSASKSLVLTSGGQTAVSAK